MAHRNADQSDGEQSSDPADTSLLVLQKSSSLRMVLHGMSSLINTRLSEEALDLCLELLEVGCHPQALADVVLHVYEVRDALKAARDEAKINSQLADSIQDSQENNS